MNKIIQVTYNIGTAHWWWDGIEFSSIATLIETAEAKLHASVDINMIYSGKIPHPESEQHRLVRMLDRRTARLAEDRALTTADYIKKYYGHRRYTKKDEASSESKEVQAAPRPKAKAKETNTKRKPGRPRKVRETPRLIDPAELTGVPMSLAEKLAL